MDAKASGKVVLATANSMRYLRLNYIDQVIKNESESDELNALGMITLFKTAGSAIVDEIDVNLHMMNLFNLTLVTKPNK